MRLLIVDGHGSHETDDFMYDCYANNIYLLFLPPHTSHVLQPLDLSIFSPIKTFYRSEISALAFGTDITPIGKITFLQSYNKARTAALTKRNITAGWKATGLWPENVAKPLMSRLVAQSPEPSATPAAASAAIEENTQKVSQDPFQTPQRSSQVRDLARALKTAPTDRLTARLLFRKIGKGIDSKNISLAAAEGRIRSLELQIEDLRPKKRKKVKEDPNSRFVRIKQIRATQIRLARQLDPNEASAAAQAIEFEGLCDEWQLE
jgi:4-hydroxybenzoate polyprenyltransferase